ncbi:MAG TPA: hypothetical protein VGK69_02820 [Gaiellaceae bacterium]
MRRILLSCASVAVLLLPAAAGARVSAHAKSRPGYLVVRKAAGDGGHPVITLVVKGFVLGRVSPNKQAQIDIYHLPRAGHAPQVVGDVSPVPVTWRGRVPGMEYNGSGFRFRAIGGYYRVVVRGAGVYLFAGGHGTVRLRGSSFAGSGGTYSLDGAAPRSMPTRTLKRDLGRG